LFGCAQVTPLDFGHHSAYTLFPVFSASQATVHLLFCAPPYVSSPLFRHTPSSFPLFILLCGRCCTPSSPLGGGPPHSYNTFFFPSFPPPKTSSQFPNGTTTFGSRLPLIFYSRIADFPVWPLLSTLLGLLAHARSRKQSNPCCPPPWIPPPNQSAFFEFSPPPCPFPSGLARFLTTATGSSFSRSQVLL